jgi:cytochrome P450
VGETLRLKVWPPRYRGDVRRLGRAVPARKTREPGGEDLLSALVAVRDEGQRLDEDELLGMAWLLLTHLAR